MSGAGINQGPAIAECALFRDGLVSETPERVPGATGAARCSSPHIYGVEHHLQLMLSQVPARSVYTLLDRLPKRHSSVAFD